LEIRKKCTNVQKVAIKMNIGSFFILNLSLVVVILFGLYLCARVYIPELAEKDVFFTSPKLGRIKARRRSGRIICFIDNLYGKGRHTNKITGKVEDGEILPHGFWWTLFGVRFIGLDQIYTYRIAISADSGIDGTIHYGEKEASSIFLEGSYPVTAILITRDGIRLKVSIQLKLTTLDAAIGLSHPNSWTIIVFADVLGKTRNFFGARNVEEIISSSNDGMAITISSDKIQQLGYEQEILGLNDRKIDKISLAERCGQRIDTVNIIDIDFADEETRRAFSAPFIAKQESQRRIKEAEADAVAIAIRSEAAKNAATNNADAIRAVGGAEAEVYEEKCRSLGGDPHAAAQVLVAEKHSTMTQLGTLVIGSHQAQVSIPVQKKEDK
jgi:hypothetical protein